ncbi:MAG: hypothetical protein HY349_08190, partial [Nitrospirae bacterium]|nr:hypothetical protein [Nitrospirota bacterium]
MKKRVQLIALIPALLSLSATEGSAFDGTINSTVYHSSQVQIVEENNNAFLMTFSGKYDLAFRKTLNDNHPFFSLYYRDLSTNAPSVYLMTEAERNAEARLVARQALYAALRETVNDVNLLYTIKEYGRAMTSANMKVKDGHMNFEGPSVNRAGNHDDPSPQETLRSSLMVINNADFGLSFRTTFGSVQSHMTYFLAGHDILGASLQKNLSRKSSLILEYRAATDEN